MFVSSTLFTVLVSPAFAQIAPATVLEHDLQVRIDYGKRLSTTQRWTVRIDDPEACVAGVLAPPGLDGAADGEALVLEDLLIVPSGTQKGDTFTLEKSMRLGRGEHSGVFATAPDLPIESARVEVKSPSSSKLTVWAHPTGDPLWSTRSGKSAVVTWSGLPAGDPIRAVWSTWADWEKPGDALNSVVDDHMSTKAEMGRDIASDLKSTNLSELARRVFQQVSLIPGERGDWESSASAAEVIRRGEGTATERAITLISLLRAAGYEAHPAQFRPARVRGAFPITVPATDMLPEPLVVTRDRAGKTLWIDPGSDAVAVPSLPASLVGATVWVPGDLPTELMNDTVVDGTVFINTTATVDTKGNLTWSSDIEASGTALEWIRRRLGPLGEEDQKTALKRLARQGRPALERFNIMVSGATNPFKHFDLKIAGHDSGAFRPYAAGLRGEVVPALATAMAGWLPPKIRVIEIVDITGPNNLVLTGNTDPASTFHADALVDRSTGRKGPRLQYTIEVIRPYAQTTSIRDASATSVLAEEAPVGVDVLMFPPTSGSSVKSLSATDLSLPERTAIETLMWLNVDNEKKAGKALKKALKSVTVADIAPMLGKWVDSDDARPWTVLQRVVDVESEANRRAIMTAMDDHGFERLAWFAAHALAGSTEPDIATEALIVQLKNQPPTAPDAAVDAEGAENWVDPDDLTARLLEQGKAAGGDHFAASRLAVADYRLRFGGDAESALDELPNDTPRASALHLTQFATTFANAEIVQRAKALADEAPTDPVVLGHLATAMSAVGEDEEALGFGLASARLAIHDADRWLRASNYALSAGRLSLAVQAARNASEIAPDDKAIADRLQDLAILAQDHESESLARNRGASKAAPDWPVSVDKLMEGAPPEALLALLQHHESEVLTSQSLLSIRSQLRAEKGLYDEAARDSINLATRHRDPQGEALAFSATAGRVFGTGAITLLSNVSNEIARLTRMEYRLITGSGDARQDARALREDPRAQDVLLTSARPEEAAAKVEGWIAPDNVRVRPPTGYRVNAILSSLQGVTGFSQADRQLAIVHVNAETDRLPAPIALLYTPRSPPLAKTDQSELIRLDGGNLPLYAARSVGDGQTIIGLGFTPQAAERALADFIPPK